LDLFGIGANSEARVCSRICPNPGGGPNMHPYLVAPSRQFLLSEAWGNSRKGTTRSVKELTGGHHRNPKTLISHKMPNSIHHGDLSLRRANIFQNFGKYLPGGETNHRDELNYLRSKIQAGTLGEFLLGASNWADPWARCHFGSVSFKA
jgi:hypothetical protein